MYFDDFNKQIKEQFKDILSQEIYILSLRIVNYNKLEKSEKRYLVTRFNNEEQFVKFYSAASFHYKKQPNDIESNEITVSDKLFASEEYEKKIFPVIKLSELNELEAYTKKEGWYWRYNINKTLLIISENELGQKFFNELFYIIIG